MFFRSTFPAENRRTLFATFFCVYNVITHKAYDRQGPIDMTCIVVSHDAERDLANVHALPSATHHGKQAEVDTPAGRDMSPRRRAKRPPV
jgi:hypothetical protein